MTCVSGRQVLDAGVRTPHGWRHARPLTLLAVAVALSVGVSGLAVVRAARPAQAAPCQSPSSPGTAGETPTATATTPTTQPTAASTTPSAAPSSAAPTADTASPSASVQPLAAPAAYLLVPAAVPTPTPAPSGTSSPQPTGCPSGSASASVAPRPKLLPAATDQPTVNQTPSVLLAASLTLTYLGVVDLPTRDSTIRTLKFSLAGSTSTSFELRVAGNSRTLSIKGGKLTVSGSPDVYATKIVGTVAGSSATYTPDSPPSATGPLSVSDATVDLVFLRGDGLNATGLTVGYAS